MRPLSSLDCDAKNERSLLVTAGIPAALIAVGMGIEKMRSAVFSVAQQSPAASEKMDEYTALSSRITKDLDEYEQFLDQKANGHVYLLAIERRMNAFATFIDVIIARKQFKVHPVDNVNTADISISYSPDEMAKIPDEKLREMAGRAREIAGRAAAQMEHLPPIDVPPGGGGGFF